VNSEYKKSHRSNQPIIFEEQSGPPIMWQLILRRNDFNQSNCVWQQLKPHLHLQSRPQRGTVK